MKKLGHDFSMKLGFRSRTPAQTDPTAETPPSSRRLQFLKPNGCDMREPEIRSETACRARYWSSGEQLAYMQDEKQNYEWNDKDFGSYEKARTLPKKLSKKSISDLTPLTSVRNMKILVEGKLVVDTFVTANNNYERSPGSRDARWEKQSESEDDITSESRDALQGTENQNKKRFMKRSKSFSGWLSTKTRWKQHEDKGESARVDADSDEGANQPQYFKRSGSFSEKIMGKMKLLNKSSGKRRNSGPSLKVTPNQKKPPDLGDYKLLIPFDYRRRMSDQTETRRLAPVKEPMSYSTSGLDSEPDPMWNGRAQNFQTFLGPRTRPPPPPKRPPLTHKGNSDLTDYKYLLPIDYGRRVSDQKRQAHAVREPNLCTTPGASGYSLDRGLVRHKRTTLERKRSNSLERLRGVAEFSDQLDVLSPNMQRSTSCGARLSFVEPSDTHLADDGTLETNLCTTEL